MSWIEELRALLDDDHDGNGKLVVKLADVDALLDCAEALEDTLKLLGYAEPSEIWERSDIKERIARNRAALAKLEGRE